MTTITLPRATVEQALEALQKIYLAPEHDEYIRVWWPACEDAIAALKAALAEPVQGPVAWRTFDGEGGWDYRDYENNEDYIYQYVKRNGGKYAHWVEPLYTTPPPRYNRSPHDLTEFVNYLCEISNKFAGTTQLNDRITTQVLWYLKHTDPLPPKF